MSKQKARAVLAGDLSKLTHKEIRDAYEDSSIDAVASSNRPGEEESFQDKADREMVKKDRKHAPLTAEEAIQHVLARDDKPRYHNAEHTEAQAVELLVKAGWEREKAEHEVRRRLY